MENFMKENSMTENLMNESFMNTFSMTRKFHDRKSSKNENFKRENSKIKTPRLQTPEGNYKTFAVKPVSITTRFVIKQQDPTIPKCLNYLVCVCVSKILLKQSIMLLSPPLKPKLQRIAPRSQLLEDDDKQRRVPHVCLML